MVLGDLSLRYPVAPEYAGRSVRLGIDELCYFLALRIGDDNAISTDVNGVSCVCVSISLPLSNNSIRISNLPAAVAARGFICSLLAVFRISPAAGGAGEHARHLAYACADQGAGRSSKRPSNKSQKQDLGHPQLFSGPGHPAKLGWGTRPFRGEYFVDLTTIIIEDPLVESCV